MPATLDDIAARVTGLASEQAALASRLDDLASPVDANARKSPAPHARRGEDPLSSRGYMYSRLFGLLTNKVAKENAKVEVDMANRLQEEYAARGHYTKAETNSILAPLSSHHISQIDPQLDSFAREVNQVVRAGSAGFDRDEVMRLRKANWGMEKALSWQDELEGGALVGPPMFGELIELLRNNEVFMRAGARVLPMPANGRIVYPRQTAGATAYWVGESTSIDESNPTTGDVVLQAKKLGILSRVPNELFRFATISVEQFLREDLMKQAALRMDKSFLEGVGSAQEPKGIINYAGITQHTSASVGTDGNTFTPEDVLQMIGKVEEQNASFNFWAMRPLMYAAIANRRADAVTAADGKGMFLFNILRELAAPTHDVTRESVGALQGYSVYKSTQVSKARTKGAGTDLSYILGGNGRDYLIAMSGVMEFVVSTQASDVFVKDQSLIRGIMFADGAPRHEASYILCDQLVVA